MIVLCGNKIITFPPNYYQLLCAIPIFGTMKLFEYSRSQQRCILFSYVAAFILGLPYWWYTISVPRSSLPHTAIANLENETTLPITLAFQWDPSCLDMVKAYNWIVAPIASTVDIQVLDRDFKSSFERVFPEKLKRLTSNPDWALSFQVLMHTYEPLSEHAYMNRVCAVSSSKLSAGSMTISENGVLAVVAERESDIAPALAAYALKLANLLANPQKSVHFSESYEVLLSLMVQHPTSTPILTWSAPKVSEVYLRPLLMQLLGEPSRFKLVTQIQYMTIPGEGVDLPLSIDSNQQVQKDPESGNWVERQQLVTPVNIPTDQLPLFINPDWNLGSVTPNHTTVHLVTFVPDPSTPMSILDVDGKHVESNSFLSPRWGGVVILNVNPKTNQLNETALHALVGVWATQLRSIFGVFPLQGPMKASTHHLEFQPSHTGISTTEVSLYHLSQYIVHVTKTAETLQALIRLTESLHNLPISKKIAQNVHDALHTVHAALGQADKSSSTMLHPIVEKYQMAWNARTSAESAFFDSDMVGLAFFPQEHKFAVYMPFFVPIFVSVAMVLLKELQLWRAGK